MNHYASLNRPGAGKQLTQVLAETELLLSAGLAFTIHTDETSSKKYIAVGDNSAWLPDGAHNKIYRTPSENIPYVSDGKESWYCVDLFRSDNKEDEQASQVSTKASTNERDSSAPVPLPPISSSASATAPLPAAKTATLPGMTRRSTMEYSWVG